MIAEANGLDVVVALIAAAALFGGTLITSYFQNRKTRRMNSEEHQQSAAERAENRDAVLMAIGLVHDEVTDVKKDLRAHLSDHDAHSTGV